MRIISAILLSFVAITWAHAQQPIPTDASAKTQSDYLAGLHTFVVSDVDRYDRVRRDRGTTSPGAKAFIEEAARQLVYDGYPESQVPVLFEQCKEILRTERDHPVVTVRAAHLMLELGHVAPAHKLLQASFEQIRDLKGMERLRAECARMLATIEGRFASSLEHVRWTGVSDQELLKLAESEKDNDQHWPYVLDLISERKDTMSVAEHAAFVEQCTKSKFVPKWIQEIVNGDYHERVAWDVRGRGYAHTVKDENWEAFHDHLGQAAGHFKSAWDLKNTLPMAAGRMVRISMAAHNKESPRVWFDRAVSAQMDYPAVYSDYLHSLKPRWGGSQESMYEFGEECLATKRFDTEVPLFMLHVIQEIAKEINQADAFRERDVFDFAMDIMEQAAADPSRDSYIRSGPTHFALKSAMLFIAIESDRSHAAQQIAEALDDRYTPSYCHALKLHGHLTKRRIDEVIAMPNDMREKIKYRTPQTSDDPKDYLAKLKDLAAFERDSAMKSPDARLARLLNRMGEESDARARFYEGEWIALPFDLEYDSWNAVDGDWEVESKEAIVGRLDPDTLGLRLWNNLGFHARVEMEATIEPLPTYGEATYTGLFIGMLDQTHFDGSVEEPSGRLFWVDPFRGAAGADFAVKTTLVVRIPVQKQYKIRVRAWDGYYVMVIDDRYYLEREAPLFRVDGYVGLGSLSYTRSNAHTRFRDVRIRQLPYDRPPKSGTPAELVHYFNWVLQMDPDNAWALRKRGANHYLARDFTAAVSDLESVVKPDDPDFEQVAMLGVAYQELGRYQESADLFESLLQRSDLPKGNVLAKNQFAWLLATCPDESIRDGKRAVKLAREVCQANDFGNAPTLDTLAAAYASAGDFKNAVKWQRQAVELAAEDPARAEMQERLQLFESGQAYHKPAPH